MGLKRRVKLSGKLTKRPLRFSEFPSGSKGASGSSFAPSAVDPRPIPRKMTRYMGPAGLDQDTGGRAGDLGRMGHRLRY